MSITLTVRPATPDEHAGAIEVWRASLAGTGSRPSAARAAQIAEKVDAAAFLLVVALADDTVVGMALGEPGRLQHGAGELAPGLVHLTMLFVHPAHQRSGVGSSLVEGLADLAWARGYRQLSTWPRSTTTAALAVLASCGLELADRTRRLPDGTTVEQWTAELEAPVREVVLHSDGLRLGQLLKLAEIIDTGAEAKALLAEGGVVVNGEVELRRGRQMMAGDVVSGRDQTVELVLPR